MNVSEANAVNVVARALTGTPRWDGEPVTVTEVQDSLDLLLASSFKRLSAGLRPGDARVLPSIGGGA